MYNDYNELNAEEKRVIVEKGTEPPFTGHYNDVVKNGVYICRQCNSPLYLSEHKFQSSCGWPSFDNEIEGAVERKIDQDGRRTEILCHNCKGHLGHVFEGEELTINNIRHCVNSISMTFMAAEKINKDGLSFKKAYFAGGCFWGIEHLMQQKDGVLDVKSGYMGGEPDNPTYEEICTKNTGHLEAIEVSYDPQYIDYKSLTKLFFELHDPTQKDGQGPDLGSQYLSAIFYQDQNEKEVSQVLMAILEKKGMDVATQLLEKNVFWPAEEYHQNYYQKNGQQPYCHQYKKLF
jgi:peptide methionine sulfoxide reductase msrA/msrB